MKKVLIGTVKVEKDCKKMNTSFSYAASFEELLVPKGEYPIYAYADDLKKVNGEIMLGWRNYIGYEGTVIRGNVGNNAGEHGYYHAMNYDYMLAEKFLHRHYWNTDMEAYFDLRPEWKLEVRESEWDGERLFGLRVVLKDGAELTYSEE